MRMLTITQVIMVSSISALSLPAIDVPHTMREFFQKSAGTWYTQRTVHHFDAAAQDQSGESNISIEVLPPTDPRVLSVCEQHKIAPSQASSGGSFFWQDNQDTSAPSDDKAAILVDIPNNDGGRSGKLLRNQGYVEKIPVISRYWFGQDGILTIDTDYENNQGQERCWFINHHFRVRVSNVRSTNGVYITTYCSERRCVDDAELAKMLERNAQRAH
jgi:CpeS-like protein